MKLLYLTSKTYPSTTADHLFITYMSQAFTRLLGDDFSLLVSGTIPDELQKSNAVSVPAPKHFKTLFYFFWIPLFLTRHTYNTREAVFFSNDRNLLTILIIWKRLLRCDYRIVSEWHMLFDTWQDRFVSRHSTKLITTTRHLQQVLSDRYKIPLDKIKPAYGGVSLERFDEITEPIAVLKSRVQLPLDAFIVGYVGFYKTMGMEKGLGTMIRALVLIQDKNVKMAFVGGRNDEIEEYSRFAEKAGVADRVIFVPIVPAEKIPLYEKAMDMLVIPYPDKPHFRDYGFPMKTYEYMASRRPILYSDLPIISEVLGDCAASFKPGDAGDLAEKILHLKNNPAEGENLANKAHVKVANYTWDKRAENIIAFLEQR